jgi:hypothetical protein
MIAALPSTTVALDPRALTSPEQIAAQLTLLTRREADLTLALNALVSDRAQVDGALLRLGDLAREVDVLSADVDGSAGSMGVSVNGLGSVGVGVGVGVAVGISPARSLTHGASPAPGGLGLGLEDDPGLVSRVSRVWETSERVGGKVRKLDDEIGRVREAADVVTEVLELKVSERVRETRETREGASEQTSETRGENE